MQILFVHNNFPAQFVHVARALAARPDVTMAAIGSHTARPMERVDLRKYDLHDVDVAATHPFARRFDIECRRAEQVLYAATALLASGFSPDVILVHPGWGENLPLRAVFPEARILAYCEFYYGLQGRDLRFDPEFPMMGADGDVLVQLKNASSLLALSDCDGGISPTAWQRSTFPPEYQSKISVIHEGVDVDRVKPDPKAAFTLPTGRVVTAKDEILTYVTRNLEPLRGCHIFLRSLPAILAKRPKADVVIVGGDGTSYGAQPAPGQTWKSLFLDEVKDRLDMRRVHFTGHLPYDDYLKVLQVSTAHVYMTYPFVTSWSLMEALSAGCCVVGSATAPVQEVIDGTNGLLVPFFDVDKLAHQVVEVLANRQKFQAMRVKARQTIVERYDMQRRCVPEALALLLPQAQANGVQAPPTVEGAKAAAARDRDAKGGSARRLPKSSPPSGKKGRGAARSFTP